MPRDSNEPVSHLSMHSFFSFCTFLFAFVLVLPAEAQNLYKPAAIDTLLAHSKMSDQLGSMSEGFGRSVRQMSLQLDSTQQQSLIKQGVAAFDSTKLIGHVRDYFAEHYREDLAVETTRQLQSGLVQSIDSRSRSDIQPEDLRQYAQGLRANPPAQSRVQLIQRMSKAQQATQFYVDNIMGMNRAIAQAAEIVDSGSAQAQALPDSTLIRRSAQNMALISFLYMYERVPQETLEEYVSFFESEAGQWYVTTYSAAINHAIKQASASLYAELEAAN